ncbi:hypothetical protein BF49_4518 [Bradyrhizobium sp.]|uniref:hypothetical protein n=1 Tax=Bradyrhizobium sp. TaxID=376 RepID=UPI0007C181EC|nr:hypothetical protein [Bradyrhizobium sp.]CUT13438.1 hypothetical protein BF49_4518 [Bradyrhizobium sp.]
MAQKLNPDDVASIAELDDMRTTVFYRDPDRPDSRFVKTRRQSAELRRAKGRLRTARYRAAMDSRKAPSVETIGMAMVVSLATMYHVGRLTEEDVNIVRRTFAYLRANGYAVEEAQATLRRLRTRLVDPADRAGEASESCGPPIRPSSWGEAPLF